jgi:hypothetical protein
MRVSPPSVLRQIRSTGNNGRVQNTQLAPYTASLGEVITAPSGELAVSGKLLGKTRRIFQKSGVASRVKGREVRWGNTLSRAIIPR